MIDLAQNTAVKCKSGSLLLYAWLWQLLGSSVLCALSLCCRYFCRRHCTNALHVDHTLFAFHYLSTDFCCCSHCRELSTSLCVNTVVFDLNAINSGMDDVLLGMFAP